MPRFRCTFLTSTGQLRQDSIEAASEAQVVQYLHGQGDRPLSIERADAEPLWRRLGLGQLGREQSLHKADLAELTRELAVMLSAGQDLDGALRFFAEARPQHRIHVAVERLRHSVQDGSALSVAMEQQPLSFPALYTGLVRAGEASGRLAATLADLATLLERQRSLGATVRTAILYPALLMLAAIGSTAFLLTHVLPQFVPLFQQNGVRLPRSTEMLIGFGNLVSQYGAYATIGVLLLVLFARRLLEQPGPRLLADRTMLHLPIVGKLAREVMAARFSRSLGTLLSSRIPLTTSLGLLGSTLGNRAGAAAVEHIAEAAKGGGGLAEPLRRSGMFPARTVYLLRLGEEHGQLGQMALRAAEIHEENTGLAVQRLVSMLVPGIIVVMGVVVAAVVSSVMAAMLSLNDLAR